MTRREELYEKCEDAIFALLMEDYMEDEGTKLLELNEQLKHDPEAAVSESSYQKGLKTIQRAFDGQKRQRFGKAAYNVVSKVAIIAVVLGLLFTTAFAASPTIRQGTLNLLITVTEESTDFRFTGHEEEMQTSNADEGYYVGNCVFPACPDGYEIYELAFDRSSSYISFIHNDTGYITMTVAFGEKQELGLDSEEAARSETVQIHGYDGLLIEKEGTINIAYADLDHVAFVQLYCTDLDRNTALSLIEQIQIVEKGR